MFSSTCDPNANTPNINFAPVIKIITDGNDMSSSLPNPQQLPLSIPIPEQPQPPEEDNSNSNPTEIDFSIPIIKK